MNWKEMTIGKKIGLGFGIVLVLLIIVGIMSYTGTRGIVGNAEEVIAGNKLDGNLAQKEVDHLNWANKLNALLTDDKITTLQVETDHTKCAFGKWLYGEGRKDAEHLVPSLAPLFKDIEAPHKQLHDTAIAIGKVFKQADPKLPAMFIQREVDHLKWAAKIRDAFIENKDTLGVETDAARCGLGKWLNSQGARTAYQNGDEDFRRIWDEMVDAHKALHSSAVGIESLLKAGSRQEAVNMFRTTTVPLLETTMGHLGKLRQEAEHELAGMQEGNRIYAEETMPSLERVQSLLYDLRREAKANIMTDEIMLNAAQRTKLSVIILVSAAVVIGLFMAFFISRGIIKVLTRISAGLGEGASQVASAAGQVSSSSQAMAEGASQQAASIEETSSSMEEMSSMTKKNAENATHADGLMKETNGVVDTARNTMSDLTTSMEEITKASEETSKIIKTIDEIAFQTNLLALNAAVEAARAGEAGAGFAVVADEVRNLAMRAADAARDTSELIEGTVKKVENGSQLVSSTNDAFTQVAESAAKVGELVAEISEASREQSEGIGQVNTAISEMDRVVQQNAANAEESASASEEMNAQAEQLRDYVGDLVMMVTGKRELDGNRGGRTRAKALPPQPAAKSRSKKQIATAKQEVRPDQVIPFDDEEGDFKDF
ncbi:MAG: CZB domain-containing protein [Desulfobacter sp.]|nr:MAG: CZB domain-containing protein [Desulfobacter sp.]